MPTNCVRTVLQLQRLEPSAPTLSRQSVVFAPQPVSVSSRHTYGRVRRTFGELCRDMFWIQGDRDQLYQSMERTPADGEIEVKARSKSGRGCEGEICQGKNACERERIV